MNISRVCRMGCIILLLLVIPISAVSGESLDENKGPITLTFVGDILLDGYVGNQISKHGVNYPFEKVAPHLRKADMTIANLETSVSTRGTPEKDKTFVFRSKPSALNGLVYSGIDAVSVANNHILDYGKEAMLDTLLHLKKYNIGATGAGKNAKEAYAPYVQTVQGKTIAVLGVSRVMPGPSWYAGENKAGVASAYSLEPMMTAIKHSAKQHDFTVVYIHWNQEFKDYPEPYARKLAKQMIDNGADMIIGSHSHCIMGIEYYQHKPIYYSLGNFVFNRSTRGWDKTLDSIIVDFEIKESGLTSKITPVKIMQGQPNYMNASYNKKTYALLNKLSYNAKIDDNGWVTKK
jgi:poly-gamma-glutamate capsule biosynthesis protein CapA/YwtB (metallophosphatase superfamily)